MPLPVEYTNLRNWPLVAKASSASEQRDWFAEFKAMMNAVDADVDAAIPKGRTIIINPDGTALQNGAALLAAYATAKTMFPSATHPVWIWPRPGDYDLNGAFITADTPYINIVSDQPAERKDWKGPPSWSHVIRAGARIWTSFPGNGALVISAPNCIFMNLDLENTHPYHGLTTQCPYSTTSGPTVIGCSVVGGISMRVPCQHRFYEVHTDRGLGGLTGLYGLNCQANGVFVRCSSVQGDSFCQAGNAGGDALIEQCIFNYTNIGSQSNIENAVFRNCRIFGDDVFNYAVSGGITADARFENCYFNVNRIGRAYPSYPDARAKFFGCEVYSVASIFVSDGCELIGNRFQFSTVGDCLWMNGAVGPIIGNFFTTVGATNAINLGGAPTIRYRIHGNVIETGGAAGTGIAGGFGWEGDNILNSRLISHGETNNDDTFWIAGAPAFASPSSPAAGTEYLAGQYNGQQLYMQRFVGTNGAAFVDLIVGASWTTVVKAEGEVAEIGVSKNYSMPIGHYYSATRYAGVLYINGTGTLRLALSTGFANPADTHDIRVYYLK